MTRALAAIGLLILSCFPVRLQAQPNARAEAVPSPWMLTKNDADLTVSLVTFGVGDAVHQYWGHQALMVEDRERDIGLLYNFGMFSFGSDMLLRYLQGQLEFWAAATPIDATFRHYIDDNRSVRVTELNLSPAKRRLLAERLAFHAHPDHSHYRYHHYFNNCSTKLRDLIDSTLDGQLRKQFSGPSRLSLRDHTRRYTQNDPIVNMLLLLWMNDSMERPLRQYDEAYLPDELERLVLTAQYVNEQGQRVPLAGRSYSVFEAMRPKTPKEPPEQWPGLLAVGVLAGALALALSLPLGRGRRWARVALGLHHLIVGLAIGLPGTVAFLGLFTEWDVFTHNENLYLTNPLTLLAFLLSFAFIAGSARAQRLMAGIWLALGASTLALFVLKVLPAFDQDTRLPMALIAPINLGCAIAHLRLSRLRKRSPVPSGVAVAA